MKKNLYIIATAMAAVLALGACSNDDENIVNGVDLSKPISLSFSPAQIDVQTRATIGVTGAFENGDRVGVYVSSSTLADAEYRNIRFTAGANNTWTSSDMYWQSGTDTYTLTAYYPFAGEEGTAAASLAVCLPADQSDPDTYSAADYLWAQIPAQAPTNGAISMTLNHQMSLLKLDMTAGDDMTLAEIATMTPAILGTIPAAGTWDLTSGNITAATEEGATTHASIRPYMDYDASANTLTYYALVMPATSFEQDSKFLTLTATNGTEFSYDLNVTGGIEAGANTYCDLDLTVNRTGITISSFSIGDWQQGKGGSGNVTMDW